MSEFILDSFMLQVTLQIYMSHHAHMTAVYKYRYDRPLCKMAGNTYMYMSLY